MRLCQRLILCVLVAVCLGLVLACGGTGGSSNRTEQTADKKWPYQFVESKTEKTVHGDVMDLYAFSGPFDIARLKAFCRDRKEKSPAKAFYLVVFFDNATNAKFPSTPFTAEYGEEKDVIKHIRAIYVYNKLNGFSELRYYEGNMWESVAKLEKI